MGGKDKALAPTSASQKRDEKSSFSIIRRLSIQKRGSVPVRPLPAEVLSNGSQLIAGGGGIAAFSNQFSLNGPPWLPLESMGGLGTPNLKAVFVQSFSRKAFATLR